jgi:hypothetical protein
MMRFPFSSVAATHPPQGRVVRRVKVCAPPTVRKVHVLPASGSGAALHGYQSAAHGACACVRPAIVMRQAATPAALPS